MVARARPLGRLTNTWLIGLAALVWTTGFTLPVSPGREEPLSGFDAPPAPHALLHVGERLTFHGHWMGIPVGSGWIEVKELTRLDGRPVYHIEAQGRSNAVLSAFYPVEDILHSYLDAATLQPLRFEKSQREGRYRAEEEVTFDYQRQIATYHSRLNGSTKDIPIPHDVQDIISAFYWLRTRTIDPRQPLSLNIYSDERVYTTTIQPHKMEILELLRRGTFPCVVLEPLAAFKGVFVKRGRLWCYFSADATRTPLLVKCATPWGLMTGVLDAQSLPSTTLAQAD